MSHLRFGPTPIRSTYLIRRAGFVAVHDPGVLDRLDVLDVAGPGATVLLNAPGGAAAAWDLLPGEAQELLVERRGAGAGVLFVSEDLDELLELSDRIAVLHDGELTGIVEPASTDRYEIGRLMLGGAEADLVTVGEPTRPEQVAGVGGAS